MAKENAQSSDAKPEGDTQPITVEAVQAECQSFIQDKLNDSSVTSDDLRKVLNLFLKLTKLVQTAA